MQDEEKTKEELIIELNNLRKKMDGRINVPIERQFLNNLIENDLVYRAIVENVGFGISLIDKDYNIVSTNAAQGKLFDKPVADFVGRKCFSEFEKRNTICSHCPGKIAMASGQQAIAETEAVLDDGQKISVRVSAFPFIKQDNEISGFIEIVENITEHKKAEKELHEYQRRLHDIIDFLPDATFVIDKDGTVLAWNRAMENMTGIKAEDLIGKGNYVYAIPFYGERRPILIDLALLSNEEFLQGHYDKIEMQGSVLRGEVLVPKTYMGKGAYLWGHATKLYNADGEVIGAIESIRDITDRKVVEKALQESERRFHDLFFYSRDGIAVLDITGHFLGANEAFCNMLGYNVDELHAMKIFSDITPQKWRDWEVEEIWNNKLLKEGCSGLYEKEYIRKDGSIFPVELQAFTAFEPSGVLQEYVWCIVRNISERKRSEEERHTMGKQLLQAQKMEALGTLSGGIAHDFNNVLASIMGYAELSMLHINNNDLQSDYFLQILKACDRAKKLVDQILLFSRQREGEKKPLDITIMVKEALKLLRASLPSTININQKFSAEQLLVLADPTHIHQIIMNLCTNAAHAMREKGGELNISVSKIFISDDAMSNHSEFKPGPYVNLKVADSGHGIEPSIMSRIFDPFFTTKKQGEGTGLGLSVVYGIVKGYDGVINVESHPGLGTTFDIYLPGLIMGNIVEEQRINVVPSKGCESILIVDDEQYIVDAQSQYFKSLGYDVVSTSSSVEALAIFRSNPHRFRLILTDMTMPQMTGLSLSDEILAIDSTIPIVLCTGFHEAITETVAKQHGVREFLTKPVKMNDLSRLIRKVLDD